MKRRSNLIVFVALVTLVMTVTSGCFFIGSSGGNEKPVGSILDNDKNTSKTPDNNAGDGNTDNSGSNIQEDAVSPIEGNDVFKGKRFSEMLWGYYEAENYEYNGSNDDTKAFREGMEYITIKTGSRDREVSALPITMHFGKYSHFMSSFNYEGEYYQPYTEMGKAMFRKAYMAEVGDLTEEDFQKIDALMNLDIAEMYFSTPEGSSVTWNVAYKITNSKVSFYFIDIDDNYNIIMDETPFVSYQFLHDGGKLILAYKGIQRNYYANGYKETDDSLRFSGYAPNKKNQYKDLEGFSVSRYDDDEISAYVKFANGEYPIDPIFELDTKTGNFTLSWKERWAMTEDGWFDTVDDSQSISGIIVPCCDYGFNDYSGFFLFIDGTQYNYLMCEAEYDEKLYSSMSGDLSDDELEDLNNTKNNILAELEKAFNAAGISVDIDLNSGKIALEASFLFDTNSYELSAEGQRYLNSFMKVYTSVVLKEEYSDFISNIIVEGHTDTSGSYSLNQTLSQNRANAVSQHCIEYNPEIEDIIKAVGCSYDYPVYNDDGTVNMAASRRVTFRFVLGEN